MGQRVYLPKDVEFDIGQIHLTPATTNIGTSTRQVYQPFRPHGENYGRWKPDEFGRSFSLAGVYDGPEADAFYALQGAGEVAARLIVDRGHNNRVHAGNVLASGYEIVAATEAITTVTGAAPISGVVYIGEGDAALDETLEVPVHAQRRRRGRAPGRRRDAERARQHRLLGDAGRRELGRQPRHPRASRRLHLAVPRCRAAAAPRAIRPAATGQSPPRRAATTPIR